jgi:hypothetical protein
MSFEPLIFIQLPKILLIPDFISGIEKTTLLQIIIVQFIVIVGLLVWEVRRILKSRGKGTIWRPFWRLKLLVYLDKDRLYHPQVLTLTIKNTGKREVEINAPVLEFRKIWSKRKFKLSGTGGNSKYPLFIEPGEKHQVLIETGRFHQYDQEIKDYYFARVYLSDVDGRKWRSNDVKLRKSWVT